MTKKSDPSLIFYFLETPNQSSFTFPLIGMLRVSHLEPNRFTVSLRHQVALEWNGKADRVAYRHLCTCVGRHRDGYLSMLNALFLFIGKWSPREVQSLCNSPWRLQL